MRRCLIIAGVFPPYGGCGALRVVKLCKYLPAHGWQVDVIAPRGRAGWHLDAGLATELGSTRVYRVGAPHLAAGEHLRQQAKGLGSLGHAGRVLRATMRGARVIRDSVAIPDEYLGWAGAALLRARRLVSVNRIDAVITTSFPYSAHLAGLALRRLGGPPWLADLRDPWVGNWFRAHSAPWQRGLDEILEREVAHTADAMTVVTPGMATMMRHRYASLDGRLHVATNGYDPADFERHGEGSDRHGEGSTCHGEGSDRRVFTAVYIGTFDAKLRPITPMLGALLRLAQQVPSLQDRFRFRVIGGADLATVEEIERWSRTTGSRVAITIEPFVPHPQAIRAMQEADCLFLSVAAGAGWMLTSKIFEYLASGQPILAAVPEGDCRDLLHRCGNSVLCDPADVEAVAAALAAAVSGGRLCVERPLDTVAVAENSHPRLARRIARILDSITEAAC
ncbi:MAG: hypothetical protein A2289_08870 [Deltaproteobacteria bacterium RIFOXYA12_FULL_58_15]|nr:MAG: hypothetical protein A2289_08870 [Deltaproteobacteria bacterium RIFOXYA12_FULL_58_15]OGR10556.1 MAG: hypothetical protein A2341_09720 [Deltaproteobacteria bacterium RIFOXYB12_FULL_58_9]